MCNPLNAGVFQGVDKLAMPNVAKCSLVLPKARTCSQIICPPGLVKRQRRNGKEDGYD